MSRTTSIIISAFLLVLAVLLFTVWRDVMDEYGAYIAIGFAVLAVFLSVAPSRSPPEDKRPD
jgi:hypothetical protein